MLCGIPELNHTTSKNTPPPYLHTPYHLSTNSHKQFSTKYITIGKNSIHSSLHINESTLNQSMEHLNSIISQLATPHQTISQVTLQSSKQAHYTHQQGWGRGAAHPPKFSN